MSTFTTGRKGDRNGMYRPGWNRLGAAFETEFAAHFRLPIKRCHVGEDAASALVDFAREIGAATALLVCDTRTWEIGGETLERSLRDSGIQCTRKQFDDPALDATDARGDEVVAAGAGCDVLIGIGAGSISDLTKYAGDSLDIPVLLYPTAASMNGYTSAITALKIRGLKRTLPCRPALGVFANPEQVATAPQRMTAAGVADFLSKCSSSTDWRASHLLLDVDFDARARVFFEGIQERLLEAAPRIGRSDPEAVGIVLEALLLSGFSMVVAGSSAPASGGEHLISHYLDMKSAKYGTPHDLHGAQVGVATVYCLGLWERILALDEHDIDPETLSAQRIPDERVREMIDEDWGEDVGAEVLAQWDEKRMDASAFRAYLDRVKRTLPRLHDELPADLLPPETVARAIKASGGPISPEGLHAPLEEYRRAQQRARFIRNRFTVLDLADDLGLT